MSALTEKVAVEHRPLAASNGSTQGLSVRCSCGPTWHEDYTAHVAEVTEAAVRAQIVADIEVKRAEAAQAAISYREAGDESAAWEAAMTAHAYGYAARIAEGGAR